MLAPGYLKNYGSSGLLYCTAVACAGYVELQPMSDGHLELHSSARGPLGRSLGNDLSRCPLEERFALAWCLGCFSLDG
jgi:hypothetical protein